MKGHMHARARSIIYSWTLLRLCTHARADIGKERLAGAAGDRRPFNEWLTKIRAFLVGSLGADITLSSDDFPHAIRFTYKGKIDVDLLVSPVWEKPQDFFYFLTRDIQDRKKRFS